MWWKLNSRPNVKQLVAGALLTQGALPVGAWWSDPARWDEPDGTVLEVRIRFVNYMRRGVMRSRVTRVTVVSNGRDDLMIVVVRIRDREETCVDSAVLWFPADTACRVDAPLKLKAVSVDVDAQQATVEVLTSAGWHESSFVIGGR